MEVAPTRLAFHEVEMNTVLEDAELVATSAHRCLVLVIDVSDRPKWVLAPLSFGINEAGPKSHAH